MAVPEKGDPLVLLDGTSFRDGVFEYNAGAARPSLESRSPPMHGNTLLPMTLAAAVPMWIHEIQQRGDLEHRLTHRIPAIVSTITERGDIILYRSPKKGVTAAAFNDLAEGIAILAFAPGGVKIFGQHWDAQYPAGLRPADAPLSAVPLEPFRELERRWDEEIGRMFH